MTQRDILHPSTLGAVYVLEESTFATGTPSQRCWPVAETMEIVPAQAELDRQNQRIDPHDYQAPVLGVKSATARFSHYLQPSSEVLTTSVSSPTDTPLAMILHAILGGESVAGGSTVASAPTVGGCVVGSGHGARFLDGQIALVADPVLGLRPVRVTQRSTDTLTWYPDLDNAPSGGGKVYNTFTWYPSKTNSKSLALAVATAQDQSPSEEFQWLLSGGTGGVSLKFDRAGLAVADFDLTFASWTGPTDYSLAYAASVDTMSPPVACRNGVAILQAQGTTTRTSYPVDSVSVKLNLGNAHLETLLGGTENVRGVIRSQGVLSTACEVEVTFPADAVSDTTWWVSRTELSFMFWIPVGATGSERMVVLDVPRCVVVGKPKVTRSGSLAKTTLTLHALRDDSCTATTELATAPFRLAIG